MSIYVNYKTHSKDAYAKYRVKKIKRKEEIILLFSQGTVSQKRNMCTGIKKENQINIGCFK